MILMGNRILSFKPHHLNVWLNFEELNNQRIIIGVLWLSREHFNDESTKGCKQSCKLE